MTPARFRWGMLLILIGTLLLLANMNVISRGWWVGIVSFMPFVLIAIGIEKLFTRSKLEIVAYLTSVALVAGAIYGAMHFSASDRVTSYFDEKQILVKDDGTISSVRAIVDIKRDELDVSEASIDVLRAWIGKGRTKPRHEIEFANGQAIVTMRSGVPGDFGPFIKVDIDREPWEIALTDKYPVEFEATADRSKLHLDFGEILLRAVNLNADQSDVYLTVGGASQQVAMALRGRDAAYEIRIPLGVGLRVIGYDDPGYFEEIGLMRTDSGFANAAYQSGTSKIDMQLDEEIGSLVIESY